MSSPPRKFAQIARTVRIGPHGTPHGPNASAIRLYASPQRKRDRGELVR